jgi:REP element-mobilizing transposase RayT
MGSTFYSLHYHVVFSTKERRPFIRPEWRARFHEYLGGIVRGLGGVAEAIGGVEDHVHLLISLKTTDAPADFVRELKKASSVWAAENHEPSLAGRKATPFSPPVGRIARCCKITLLVRRNIIARRRSWMN